LLWLTVGTGAAIVAGGFPVGDASLLLPDVAHTATHKPLTMHTGQQALLQ